MANLVSQELRSAVLAAYFSGGAAPTNLYLHLFKDEANITETTTMADIAAQVQAGSGYAVKTIAPADWTVEPGTGGIRVRLTDQTWTTTADNWNTLRWAVLSNQSNLSGTILMARDYGTGKTVTGVGANVTVDDLFFQIND